MEFDFDWTIDTLKGQIVSILPISVWSYHDGASTTKR